MLYFTAPTRYSLALKWLAELIIMAYQSKYSFVVGFEMKNYFSFEWGVLDGIILF